MLKRLSASDFFLGTLPFQVNLVEGCRRHVEESQQVPAETIKDQSSHNQLANYDRCVCEPREGGPGPAQISKTFESTLRLMGNSKWLLL